MTASVKTLPALNKIIQGDVLEELKKLPDGCVQTIVTSPSYWGLRDYKSEGVSLAGQWGSEPTLEAHIANIVALGRELWRVLRDDGTFWLNYGDCYATSPPAPLRTQRGEHGKSGGLKAKDLVGMPWRVALALQADGWWLRARCPWIKMNGMPESVTDRPAVSHEDLFLLSKNARYFYDADTVRVGYAPATIARADGSAVTTGNPDLKPGFKRQLRTPPPPCGHPLPAHGEGRSRRDAGESVPLEPVPCIVLDPFAGSGTVGVVAAKLGRDFIGIDLAGGDAELGMADPVTGSIKNPHTAHDRLRAAAEGRDTENYVRNQVLGQMEIFSGAGE